MRTLFPQLAKNVETSTLELFIENPKIVQEQKLDGHRLLLQSTDGLDMPPAAITRNGTPYSRRLPQEILNFRFPEGDWILDGEFVDGVFWVFDLPHTPLPDWDRATLTVRRAALETFLDTYPNPFRLVPQARTRDEKIELAARALREGFEGLMFKNGESIYKSAGRNDDWLKLKFVSTVDVVVTDVRSDGKDSVGYAIWDNGTLTPIGRASLIGKEKNGAIAVGDVIEVRYLYVGADGRLYQPTIVGKRTDKDPHECTGAQLRYVNKKVLEAL